MVEKEVIAEVKRAWAYYQYAANLCSMYRDQDKMAEELKRIGEIRYQQGEITLLEKNMMTTTAARIISASLNLLFITHTSLGSGL